MYYLYLNRNHELILCCNENNHKSITDSVNVKELLGYKEKVISCVFHQQSTNLCFAIIKAEKVYCLAVHIIFNYYSNNNF